MGVCVYAQTLSVQKIQAIRAHLPWAGRVIAPDDPQAYLREIGQHKPPGFCAIRQQQLLAALHLPVESARQALHPNQPQ